MAYLGEFEQMVLFAVLRLGERAYGVAIRDEIETAAGRSVSSGAIYTTLGRLEERGLVESAVQAAEPGRVGRPRRQYRLLPPGARALQDAYAGIQALAGGVLPQLAKLAEEG